jgi:flagellar biogenesis protein FliO
MLVIRRRSPRWLLFCALALSAPAPLFAQVAATSTIKFASAPPSLAPGDSSGPAPLALPDWPDQQAARYGRQPAPTPPGQPRLTAQTTAPDHAAERPWNYVTQATANLPITSSTNAPEPSAATTAPPPSFDGLAAARDPRRLGAPKPETSLQESAPDHTTAPLGFVPNFGLPLDAMYTTGAALAIVVGLFLLCAWALRRGARNSVNLLSTDVAQVLGRVPLADRQFAELIHVGNKLVLVSVTASGAETLTEITDPLEVDRLLGLCKQHEARSSTAEFDEVFRELAEESAPDAFLGEETIRLDARSAAKAYANQRGGTRLG